MKVELAEDGNGKATVYDALLTRIRRSISTGALKPGALIGSEYELARESGISRVSVRRATEALLREGLVERRPGKGLFVREENRSTRTVQILVPDLGFDQCVQIVRGAQLVGMERGIRVQVYDAHSLLDFDIETLRQLPSTTFDGAIIVSWHHPEFAESLFELKRKDYPFVLVDEKLHDMQVPSVLTDNYGGGYAAGKATAEMGHVRIAFIGDLNADTVRARLDGIRDAINDAGVPFDRSRVIGLSGPLNSDWPTVIDGATRKAMDRPDRPTAILFSNDQTAAHGAMALRRLGCSIPQQVSIVGFDDNPLCQLIDPPLSTVRQPSMEMGKAAMEMLLELFNRRRNGAPPALKSAMVPHVVLPTTWVPRKSLASAPVE